MEDRRPVEYPYKPLDSSIDSIRLIVLHPPGDGKDQDLFVKGSLVHSTFLQKLKYEALSYTWGSPEKTKFISLDGIPVEVAEISTRHCITYEQKAIDCSGLMQSVSTRLIWVSAGIRWASWIIFMIALSAFRRGLVRGHLIFSLQISTVGVLVMLSGGPI